MLTSYDQKHSAQMDIESRVRQSLSVISSPVNHVSFRSDLENAFDLRQSLPGPIRGGVGGEVADYKYSSELDIAVLNDSLHSLCLSFLGVLGTADPAGGASALIRGQVQATGEAALSGGKPAVGDCTKLYGVGNTRVGALPLLGGSFKK